MKIAFRIISFLEGLSYLLLLFVAVPLKYFSANDTYVKMLGMPHGVLFIFYIVLAFMLKPELKWAKKVFSIILVASVLPFGTFYIDRKYLTK